MDHSGLNICYRYSVFGEEGIGCRFRHDRQGENLPLGWALIDETDWVYQENKQMAAIDTRDANTL
eukprot:11901352-Karenia_brevis.AAC.1